jgi:hypothetical protein
MALIIPRCNPLAFPGGNPGINRAHRAYSNGLRYVGVAQNGSFQNLLAPARPTVNGSPTSVLTGLGPGTKLALDANYLTTTVNGAALVNGVLLAAIVTPITTGQSFGTVFTTGNFSGSDYGIILTSGLIKIYANGNSQSVASEPTIVANTPYFVVFNWLPSSSVSPCLYGVSVNLLTGQVLTGVIDGTPSLNTPGASFSIGGLNGTNGAHTPGAIVHAVMYADAALTLPDLVFWAKAPWDFWYPQTAKTIMSLALKGAVTVSDSSPAAVLVGL